MKCLLLLANYNTWVNTQIFKLCGQLSDSDYRLDRGVFFGSIHHTLNHLLLVDMLWLARLKREPIEHIHSLDQVLYDDFETLTRVRQQYDQKLIDYVESLKDDDLETSVPYTRMTGQQGQGEIQQTLLTLFNHQTHHRGQIHAMLTQSGIDRHDMPGIDIVDYLASVPS